MIVAEIGVNHNGDVNTALKLIDAADKAGATAVKTQLFDAERLEPPGPRRDMLKALELPRDDIARLKDHAEAAGMAFFATPFDEDALAFLVGLGVPWIKTGSADLTNTALLEAIPAGYPAILSSGMATMDDIAAALDIVPHAFVLQCTSAYPARVEDANLRAMCAIRERFGVPVGLSDHSTSEIVPAAAVAMGARVIEKHFTLDRNMDGPDHAASMEPSGFARMVANVCEVTAALGTGIKEPAAAEARVMAVREERRQWRER